MFFFSFLCDLRVLVRKLARPFGHPTQVSTQVQLASTCDYLPVRLARTLAVCMFRVSILSFSQLVSRQNSTNSAIWLVPGVGGFFSHPDRHSWRSGRNSSSWYIFVNELAVIVNLPPFLHFHRRSTQVYPYSPLDEKESHRSKFKRVFWSCESLFGCL